MSERGTDRTGRRVTDARERVEEAFLAHGGRRRFGGAQAQREAPLGQHDAERGGHRDGALEGGGVGLPERMAPVVQEHEPARAPGRLVLADHQVARACHRRPVDPSQIVTELVLAHRVVLLAGPEELSRPGGPPVRAEARVGGGEEVLDLRRDEQLVDLVELQTLPRQREGVGDVDRERPQPVPTTGLRQHRIGHALRALPRQTRDDQARRAPERGRQAVLDEEHG